jgi:hypothetical protein
VGAAKGTIVVPAGKFVTFIPAHHFYQNPAIINTLPADGIDCLSLSAVSLDDSEDGLCDRALAYVGHLTGLIVLNLDKSDATDKGAQHAAALPNLQKISAFQSTVEGKCFKQLLGLKHLRCVRLASDGMKDENMQYISALPYLEQLILSHTTITDEGMQSLANCSGLIALDLSENPRLTDKSLKPLLSLKKLSILSLGGTSITLNGIMQLKNLPLVSLGLPGSSYPLAQLKTLRKALPGAQLIFNGRGGRPVDADINNMFAPLH